MSNLWLCGQYIDDKNGRAVWEFQGVFSTKELATKACKNRNYFILPVELDKEFPEETIVMHPVYPLAESE